MRKCLLFPLACITCLCVLVSAAEKKEDDGFVSIFDGQTLKGWHTSAQTGHSKASGNKSGGRWVVENGAIVGSQDIPGNGGIIITDYSIRIGSWGQDAWNWQPGQFPKSGWISAKDVSELDAAKVAAQPSEQDRPSIFDSESM